MRAAVIDSDRTVCLRDLEEPALQPGQARVRVARCGICGTDVRLPEMEDIAPAGTVPGHEIAGEVVETRDCERVKVGSRVAVYPNRSCGMCPACILGEHQFCVNGTLRSLGLGTPGGYAERLVLDEQMLEPADDLDDDTAAFAEPLAVVVHVASRVSVASDTPICVVGAGPLGSLLALYLRALGAERIVMVHPSPPRRKHMQAQGFTVVTDTEALSAVGEALGEAPAVVFECAGTTSAATLAVALVAVHGTVILAGGASVAAPLTPADLLVKEAWVSGSFSCSRDNFATAMRTLRQGDLGALELVTSTIALDQLPAMLEELGSGGSAQMKVVVAPNGP
jgi:threonine dehydrogenase-like Zn-dependent dehydrogenase